jgi:formylglycine-generating enzyme required for sulfatase activity
MIDTGKYESAFRRGGDWDNNDNAGLFNMTMNNLPSNTNNNIGFRCVVPAVVCVFTWPEEMRSKF